MKPHFKLGSIPVRVEPWFFMMAVMLWAMDRANNPHDMVQSAIIWMVVVFTGVLLHELGHALAGRAFGLVPKITLYGMGGFTSWERGRHVGPARSIAISFAGPAVGIVIGLTAAELAAHLAPPQDSLLGYTFESIVFVNLWWGLLNLVPMQPLDGGNIMASMFEMVLPKKGPRLARFVSIGVAVVIVILLIMTQRLFMAFFVASMVMSNVRALQAEHAIGDDIGLRGKLSQAFAALEQADAATVQRLAEEIAAAASTDTMKAQAAQLLAWSWFLRSDWPAARAALARAPSSLSPDPALEGAILLELGDADAAVGKLVAAAEMRPSEFVDKRIPRAFVATKRFKYAAIVMDGPVGQHLSPDALYAIEHAAYAEEDFESAAKIGETLFKRTKEPLRAFNVACSMARAGKPAEALDWLERAKEAGFRDLETLDQDADLAPVRELSRYQQFRSSFKLDS